MWCRFPTFSLVVTLALSACGTADKDVVEIAVIGSKDALVQTGPRLAYPAQLVRSATIEGMVAFDEQGRVIPALADRWIVTDGGQSYIFRLRDGTWPDGSPITGESARASLQRAITSLRGTPLALDLAGIEEIRAMAGRVIEVRLSQPRPDLLQLLAQPEMGMAYKGRGAGPMRLARDGSVLVLTPMLPEDRGLPSDETWRERTRKLRIRAVSAQAAIARFDRGESSVVLGGRIEDFPRLDVAGLSRGAIRLDPVAGLFGLAVTHSDGFFSQSGNREAIAMAIDRDGLIAAFGVGGWTGSTRIVSPGMEGDIGTNGERWADYSLAQRRAAAADTVKRWRAGGREAAPLRIALPAGPGADRLFDRLNADLKTIGLESRRVSENAPADLRLIDQVARYPRAAWFLHQLSCGNARGLCNSSADSRATQARATLDPVARANLLAEAESTLTAANVFIPFGPPIRWSLVSGDATGFAANRWGVHPLMPLAMRPK